jgi:hypothetical protein
MAILEYDLAAVTLLIVEHAIALDRVVEGQAVRNDRLGMPVWGSSTRGILPR